MTHRLHRFWLSLLLTLLCACSLCAQPMRGQVDMGQPVNWASPLNRGLVSWWAVLPDTNRGAVTWRDIARQNHGTLTNMDPTTDWKASTRPGGFGALDFDGADTYLNTGSSLLDGVTNDFAVFCWVRPSAVASLQALFGKRNIPGTAGFDCALNSAALRFVVVGVAAYDSSGITVSADSWQFVGFIKTGSIVKFVYNGDVISSSSTGTISAANGATFVFGIRLEFLDRELIGQADGLRVFTSSPTDSQVKQLYLDDLAGNPQTLKWITPPNYFYEAPAPGGGGSPVPIIQHYQSLQATARERDRRKFYAAIGIENEWGLAP